MVDELVTENLDNSLYGFLFIVKCNHPGIEVRNQRHKALSYRVGCISEAIDFYLDVEEKIFRESLEQIVVYLQYLHVFCQAGLYLFNLLWDVDIPQLCELLFCQQLQREAG